MVIKAWIAPVHPYVFNRILKFGGASTRSAIELPVAVHWMTCVQRLGWEGGVVRVGGRVR